jgi:hypothetical protein
MRIWVSLLILLSCVLYYSAFAKRMVPKEVPSIINNGINKEFKCLLLGPYIRIYIQSLFSA